MNAWFRGMLLGSFVFMASLSGFAEDAAVATDSVPKITADEAINYVGKKATVCGVVAEAVYLSRSERKLTFLNFDKSHPDQMFDVVIEDADRAKFSEAPEIAYKGKRICVTGLISEFKSKAQMSITDPSQITVADEAETAE